MSNLLPGVGSRIGGRYPLTRLLGQGGMGGVFESNMDGERVAVKVMTAGDRSSAGAQRFLREAKIASSVRHEHLVPVLDVGVDAESGRLFLVMPLIEGQDLGAALGRTGPLFPAVAVRLLLQAARGVSALHEAGVVHRDLKPSNLLLSVVDDSAFVRVCDFGIAKDFHAAQLTASSDVLGSPLYMAPEQMVSTKKVGTGADVWSLGVTLYEALTGYAPFFNVASMSELIVSVTTRDIPPLQDLAPWVDPRLAVIVHAALLREPSARCPSVAALVAALQPFAGDSLAVPPSALRALTSSERGSQAARAPLPNDWASALETGSGADFDERIGSVIGGAFRLTRKLGQGGMGAVYEAQRADGLPAAVKVITGSDSEASLRRFVREARAVMAIESDYVVRVLAAEGSPAQGPPYLAMELLTGVDLDGLVEKSGALEPWALARLFVQACRGVAAAHARGIVHRDIKPANLFLHELPSGQLVLKVCDFGIAKHVGAANGYQDTTLDLTRTGGLLGSPLYMSPEQARNAKQVDVRTDIWSLAISMYQGLTGEKPWQGCSTMGELILAICTGQIAPVQDRAPWVDARLADIVHCGLEPDPSKRWSSATDMADALEALVEPQATTLAALRGLSSEARARAAVRRSTSATANTADPTSNSLIKSKPTRRRWLGIALSGGLVLAVTAFLFEGRTRSAAHASESVVTSPSLGLPAAPARRHVELRIHPETASVTVRGAPTTLTPDGILSLDGEVGESFAVVARDGESSVNTNVVISREGGAMPPELDLSTSKASLDSSAEARPRSAAPRASVLRAQKGSPPSAPATSAKTVVAVPSAAPPPVAPKFQDNL